MATSIDLRRARFGALLLLLFFGVSFLASTFFKGGDSLHFLRGETPINNNERHLQRGGVVANIVNALISFVTPTISKVVQNVMRQEFETLEMAGRGGKEPGELSWQTLGSVTENVTLESRYDGNNETAILCETSTIVKYALESVKGLDKVKIDKLNFVVGSQKVNVGFMGRSDTTWEGQWNLEVSFSETLMATTQTSYLTSTTTEECQVNDDEDDMGTTSFLMADEDSYDPNRGSIAMKNIKARVLVTVRGSTGRLVLFPSTTTIESATIDLVDIDFPSTVIKLGSSPLDTYAIGMQESSDTPTIIDADAEFGGVAKAGLENYVESGLITALQEEVDRRFPTELII